MNSNDNKAGFRSYTPTDEEFERARAIARHIMKEFHRMRTPVMDGLRALEMVTGIVAHLASKAYGMDPMALIDTMAINARQYLFDFDPEDSEDNHQPTPDQP